MENAGQEGEASRFADGRKGRLGVLPATLGSSDRSPLNSTLPAATGERGGELGEEPQRIGRFVVLSRIGAGGMGVVYSGYDELLDRRLAIKLVRGEHYDPTAQTRMLREAQALARLSHPNVVQVYEVGEFSGQIYLAMEFVRGETLRAWVQARREDPVEGGATESAILERFLAAGEGLAAAHAAGLIHRDFKPDNVLVGEDGRVRVVDFGLAAAADGAHEPREATLRESSSDAFEAPLTHVGAILGTPAYMAPEQLAGSVSDARADVFSFAVALHEALFGARPFVGDTIQELLRNIHAEKRTRPDPLRRRRTHWIVPVIERGLASDPDERWQTMAAFLAALRDDPERRRRRLRWVLTILALSVVAAGVVVFGQRAEARRCDDASAAIDRLWGAQEQLRIEEAVMASGSPHAEATWERLREGLGEWTGSWREARTEACRSGEDDELASARIVCLERQLWRLEGLLGGLAVASPETVNRGVAGVSRLDPVSRCDDLRWLGAFVRDEERGYIDPRALAIERRLARLRGLLSLGAFSEVAAQIVPLQATLASLSGADIPRLAAELRFIEGSAARKLGDFEAAAVAVADAYYRAGALGDDRLAAEAAMIEVAILGVDLNRGEEAESWAASTTMMLERAGLAQADLGAMWLMIRGVIQRHKGEYGAALESYEAAKTIIARELGPRHPEIAKIYANMASASANRRDYERGVKSLREGLEIFVESQGEDHPEVAVFHGNLGAFLVEMGRVEEGLAEHRLALAANRVTYGDDHPAVSYDFFNIGYSLLELGEHEEAAVSFAKARTIIEEKLGPEHPMLGYVLSEQGRNAGSFGDVDLGIELLERAEKIRLASGDPADVGTTRFYLARLLWERPEQRGRAREMALHAREVFASEEFKDTKFLPQVEAWLREHPAEVVGLTPGEGEGEGEALREGEAPTPRSPR